MTLFKHVWRNLYGDKPASMHTWMVFLRQLFRRYNYRAAIIALATVQERALSIQREDISLFHACRAVLHNKRGVCRS